MLVVMVDTNCYYAVVVMRLHIMDEGDGRPPWNEWRSQFRRRWEKSPLHRTCIISSPCLSILVLGI